MFDQTFAPFRPNIFEKSLTWEDWILNVRPKDVLFKFRAFSTLTWLYELPRAITRLATQHSTAARPVNSRQNDGSTGICFDLRSANQAELGSNASRKRLGRDYWHKTALEVVAIYHHNNVARCDCYARFRWFLRLLNLDLNV